jgi:NADPH-dependent glutamate synthase beta subunit-like oxidoreductase
MAVIGSGPAGFYTAYKVMSKIENSVVDMYEHLPVPFGLVRFGVAPDHPEVKVDLLLRESTIMMLRMRFRTARINSKK